MRRSRRGTLQVRFREAPEEEEESEDWIIGGRRTDMSPLPMTSHVDLSPLETRGA